jgi:HD-GYP domain-containing protein (c-di-GMP phosphodiesterase class II)
MELEQLEIDGQLFSAIPIPIDVLIKHVELWTDPFVLRFRDGKMLVIEKSAEELLETFQNYQHKNLDYIWAKEIHVQDFCSRIRQKLKEQLKQSNSNNYNEQDLLNLEDAYVVIKKMLLETGLEEGALTIALEVNRQIIDKFKTDQKFLQMLRQMRNRCSEQFLKNLYASVLVQAMARNFSWSSTAIFERMVMAIMTADIGLSNRDYQFIKEGDIKALSKEALMHPVTNAKMLSRIKNLSHPETMTMIEQHHEWPNGQGFPKGLKAPQIHFLSAFVITAQAFVDLEFISSFETENKYRNLEQIYQALYIDGNHKNFKEAVSGLFLALGLKFPADDKSQP